MNKAKSAVHSSNAAHSAAFRALHIHRHASGSTVTRINTPAPIDTTTTSPSATAAHVSNGRNDRITYTNDASAATTM